MTGPLSAIALELMAAACIGFSGVPGFLSRRWPVAGRAAATGLCWIGSALGFAGLVLHAQGGDGDIAMRWALPLGRIAFRLDGLAAFFLVPVLLISALGSLYGSSYWGDEHRESGPRLRLWWGLMTASMMAVVLAGDAILFLIVWELMALAAFFLIATEDQRAEVREASWIYLVATHAGTLCLLGCFLLLVHAQQSTALWPILGSEDRAWLVNATFALGIAGFGLKAGLVPLHVWLPGAHANAPSHVSALLSGVLLNMGVYGVVRICGLLPHPPLWWGTALLVSGAASGLFGIVFAVAQQDLKRLLAYSSIENIGIVVMGIGLASIGRSIGRVDLVVLGISGALLHALNHSFFKSLLFMVAGSVLHATGTRRISSLGGLARTMPHTFTLFVIGAIAICGLPPLNGFASELLLYMGLLRAAGDAPVQGWAWAGLAVPVLAMIGALAVASFVKVAGVAFCGDARSSSAAHAHDPGPGMLAPMVTLAGACILFGLYPSAAIPLLQRAVAAWVPALGDAAPPLSTLAPLGWISALGGLLVASAGIVGARFAGRRSAQTAVGTWDCGYKGPTPRMQYVEASFSETLVSLFDWALRSRRVHPRLQGPFPPGSRFEIEVPDAVLDGAVLPSLGAADRGFARMRAIQRGPVHTYLLYILLAVMALLLFVR
jgi:hydrogenase-4 component B